MPAHVEAAVNLFNFAVIDCLTKLFIILNIPAKQVLFLISTDIYLNSSQTQTHRCVRISVEGNLEVLSNEIKLFTDFLGGNRINQPKSLNLLEGSGRVSGRAASSVICSYWLQCYICE